MAEFKISRFRYTWRGNWNTPRAFIKDDVVKYGGSSWVCVRSHTSSVFQTDQEFLANLNDTDFTPAWVKMTDGRSFRGSWNQSTLYNPGDILKYAGNLYLVVTSFTSSEIFDDGLSYLAEYIVSVNWRGSWAESTRYGQGDLVRYGGKIYRCISGHTSGTASEGPEVGNNDANDDSTLEVWEIYYDATFYRGEYNSNGIRYAVDDLVSYKGSLLRCTNILTSTDLFDSEHWSVEADGNEFESDWADDVYYGTGSIVRYGGFLYRAIKASYEKTPIDSFYQANDPNAPYWEKLAEGLRFRGTWSPTGIYKTGDVVRRGGLIYKSLLDQEADGSSLGYLDTSNWEILISSINWRSFWNDNVRYSAGDIVIFKGSVFKCNLEHISTDGLDSNSPGDTGNDYAYWDLLIETDTENGMRKSGDLLTYNLSRNDYGDGSTIGLTRVPIGIDGQLLSIDDSNTVLYKNYGQIARSFFVSLDGVDDIVDSQRGVSSLKPWRTVRFACEQADDGYQGTTTINVDVGEYREILPIIIPARTVVLGSELRSTTIRAADALAELSNDSTYRIAVLNRIKAIMPEIVDQMLITKSSGNQLNQVIATGTVVTLVSFDPQRFDPVTGDEIFQSIESEEPLEGDQNAATDVQNLIDDIVDYINFYINSTGNDPSVTGTNTASTIEGYVNTAEILEANKEFLAEEAVSFLRAQFPSYVFNRENYKKDIKIYIDAFMYDIIYTGNYKTVLAARHYKNAVLGSARDDMFYCRDTTGVRNCTLKGLQGTLNPADSFDLYQRPTGGAYTSLDPGWGPNDTRTWIVNRSPYIQGVTNIGDNCVGIKVDGALHNGGNKSMVANDYTQVLSDGIGAWVANNGRSELVSVFTYYCTIGYYAKDGGIIRATNGNCSYGNYGAISDGVDPTETPEAATVNGRTQQAQVYQALAGEFVDEITVLEFSNAGRHYTTASADFVGAGVNAEVSFEDFRDNAVFEARLTDELPTAVFVGSIEGTELTVISIISGVIGLAYELTGTGISSGTQILSYGTGSGGVGTYNINQEQTVFETTITGVTTNLIAQYVGGGGYSVQQNNAQPHSTPNGDLTSITIASNDANAEGDYLGKRIIITSGTGTGQYGYITAYNAVSKVVSVSRDSDDQPGWDHVIPGRPIANPLDTTTRYRIEPRVLFSDPPFSATSHNITVTATWNNVVYGETTKTFSNVAGDSGTGEVIEDDGLEPIIATFDVEKIGRSYEVTLNNPGAGYLVGDSIVLEGDSLGGITPDNDITITVTATTDDSTNQITAFTFEGFGESGVFVSLPDSGNQGIYSKDGQSWTALTTPSAGDWRCLASGDNKFVAIRYGSNVAASSLDGINWTARSMPSSRNWSSVVYGENRFVAVSANQNSSAYSTNGTTWVASSMPTIGDSAFNEWVDITYGKGIFVAISNSQNISASSTDGVTWEGHIMDVIADSSQKDWISVTYGNNRFVAISTQGDVAYSFDGSLWYPASMPTQDGSTAHFWRQIRYAQGVFFAVGDTGARDVGADTTTGPSNFAATSEDGVNWKPRALTNAEEWRSIGFGNPFIPSQDSSIVPNTGMWIAAASGSTRINRIMTGCRAKGRAYTVSGRISLVSLFDTGSGYLEPPALTITDPSSTSDATFEVRLGDGVLSNPEWINRGLGYRTTSTTVNITGNGYADSYTVGKFMTLDNLDFYPGPGAQVTFAGNPQRFVVSQTIELGQINGGLSARFRVQPDIKVRDNLDHGTVTSIQIRYSQCRITGHDFLDIGTGNFEETNYPELYATGNYIPEPEAEVYEEDGGRVFYTSTDQSGNFRTGELFAVEQATGIVTISADFFDLAGLTELRLGGIRVGGTGAVIREFSTDALFTADSNNIVPTQRAIKAYLNNRLTVGGSEIATSSFIAGLVRVGPDQIDTTIATKVVIPQRADFETASSGIKGLMMAQSLFHRSFSSD